MGRKKHIIQIDTPEQKAKVLKVFESLNSKNQIHIYYGISDNKQGSEYVRHIAQEIGFDLNTYKIRKQKPKRYCLECGKEITKRTNEKFCCSSCSASYNNRKRGSRTKETKKKISEGLKKYFKNINSQNSNNENIPKSERYCLNCGKNITNSKNIKFCSRSCSAKYRNEKKYGSDKNREKRYCLECGKELKNCQKKFCSNHCSSQYVHKKAYQYYIKHQDEFCRANYVPKCFYDMFLEEQNHRCIICGQEDIHNGKRLRFVIDHIDGDASNNHRDNLRLVCPNCDSQLDTFKSKNKNSKRRNYWKEKILRNLLDK